MNGHRRECAVVGRAYDKNETVQGARVCSHPRIHFRCMSRCNYYVGIRYFLGSRIFRTTNRQAITGALELSELRTDDGRDHSHRRPCIEQRPRLSRPDCSSADDHCRDALAIQRDR